MTERALPVDAREGRGLHDGSITLVVRPCKEHLWLLLDEIERANGQPAWQCLDFDAKCPLDADRLWVQETFQAWELPHPEYGDCDLLSQRAMDDFYEYYQKHPEALAREPGRLDHIEYRATSESTGPWRSSTQMPRWASRTVLDAPDVRVARLDMLTDEDGLAAGVDLTNTSIPGYARERLLRLLTWRHPGIRRDNPWLWLATVAKVKDSARVGAGFTDAAESAQDAGV